VGRAALEVADIFRLHGPAWREAQHGHLSLAQLKVMSAIEQCRSAALGGHVLHCGGCGAEQIAYNSCRNRHCPKCQASAAQRWLDARSADLLPVEYYHVVFTLPAPVADIAYQNKAAVYGLLFDAAAETLLTIAADPKHLGARIGATLVLHTWGSALTHHPHVHGIVPGGGLAPDGTTWIACRQGFFLPVRVLSRLFRRRFLEELQRVHQAGELRFYGEHVALADVQAFKAWLAPLRRCEWVVYAKQPFAGPQAVLAYLSRYTHRVAISNSRLIALEGLPRQGPQPLQGDDVGRGRVHASLPAARAARRLPPHPPLRFAGQLQPQRQPRPRTAPAAGAIASGAAMRRRAGRRATDLRLRALWPRNGHRPDLHARRADPRTALSVSAMNSIRGQRGSRPSTCRRSAGPSCAGPRPPAGLCPRDLSPVERLRVSIGARTGIAHVRASRTHVFAPRLPHQSP
jgi:Putative transposase/Transposase zinc-binding domain